MKKLCTFSFVAVAWLSLIPSAHAQTLFDVQFQPGSEPVQSGSAILGTSTDVDWNQDSNTDDYHDVPGTLVTSTGASSLATFTYTYGVDAAVKSNDSTQQTVIPKNLMQNYIYDDTIDAADTATVTGLTAGDDFTLVLYGAGLPPVYHYYGGTGYAGDSLTLTGGTGGNTGDTLTTTSGSADIADSKGIAYNTFTGVVGLTGSLTVTIAVDSGNAYSAFNGLQVEEDAPAPPPAPPAPPFLPEPGTSALIGVGLTALLLVGRRRLLS
jgi:hypothetical protein